MNKKRRIRELALASQTRLAVLAAVWLSLFAYAGRPVLAGAAAAGLAPAIAWALLIAVAALPLLPMVAGRRSAAHWSGYAVLAVFSTLLVLVFVGDVLRGAYMLARWAVSAQTWPFARRMVQVPSHRQPLSASRLLKVVQVPNSML